MIFEIGLVEKTRDGAWFSLSGEKDGTRYTYPILIKDAERMSNEQIEKELQDELRVRFGLQTKWEGQEIEIKE